MQATIKTMPEQGQAMQSAIVARSQSPGAYRLGGNNCVDFVSEVLKSAGVQTPNVVLHEDYMYQLRNRIEATSHPTEVPWEY